PALECLRQREPDRDERRLFIGGSDANVILSGGRDRFLALGREKPGEAAAEDLSGSLAVMLGCWTEPFNRQWYERVSGERVKAVGLRLNCPKYEWRRCTVDGL